VLATVSVTVSMNSLRADQSTNAMHMSMNITKSSLENFFFFAPNRPDIQDKNLIWIWFEGKKPAKHPQISI